MKILFAAFALAMLATAPARAELETGDTKMGKTLHDKACISCHAQKFGEDGTRIYTRSDHKVTNKAQLSARVKACNNNVGSGWFPEEEAHVAAYLNATYYHLK